MVEKPDSFECMPSLYDDHDKCKGSEITLRIPTEGSKGGKNIFSDHKTVKLYRERQLA